MINVEDVFAEDATTTRTLGNIKKALRSSLERKYGDTKNKEELREIEEEILKIHGLHKINFDFISRVEGMIKGHFNDNSIDDNSNKNEKTMQGIMNEASNAVSKAVGYDYLYRTMVDLYGKKEAKRLSGELYDYSLAISDSTKMLIPYCWAFDASKIVLEGRPFGQLQSKPPKSVMSYTNALVETIHQMSSHLAGAIAISSFFFDYTHLVLYKEKRTLEDLKTDGTYRKYIENNIQSFVHSVNHLSRSGVESPFSNISIFDDVKIRGFIKDMDYYFNPKHYGNYDYDEDYIVNTVKEIQDIYMDFFDKGDPSRDGLVYRFPVSTINISKTDDGNIEDRKFLTYITSKDIFRYNIFVSSGSKLASCCRLLSDSEMLDFAGQSNSFGGGGAMSLGSHRVVTINFNRIALDVAGKEDKYFEALSSKVADTISILKAHKDLIQTLTESGLQQFINRGWINMSRMFSTVGLLGIVEAADTVSKKSKIDKDAFIRRVLVFVNERVQELGAEKNLIVNLEQIPAESMAHRLPKVDKMIYGEKSIKYPLYSNQFIPLWQDVSVWDRIEKDGIFNQLITGGGIVHFPLGEKTTKTQNKKLIDFAVETGCEHFALNPVYSICEKDHVNFGNSKVCPKCGSKIISKITRTVGFFTPVEDWTEKKRDYDFERRNYNGVYQKEEGRSK